MALLRILQLIFRWQMSNFPSLLCAVIFHILCLQLISMMLNAQVYERPRCSRPSGQLCHETSNGCLRAVVELVCTVVNGQTMRVYVLSAKMSFH